MIGRRHFPGAMSASCVIRRRVEIMKHFLALLSLLPAVGTSQERGSVPQSILDLALVPSFINTE